MPPSAETLRCAPSRPQERDIRTRRPPRAGPGEIVVRIDASGSAAPTSWGTGSEAVLGHGSRAGSRGRTRRHLVSVGTAWSRPITSVQHLPALHGGHHPTSDTLRATRFDRGFCSTYACRDPSIEDLPPRPGPFEEATLWALACVLRARIARRTDAGRRGPREWHPGFSSSVGSPALAILRRHPSVGCGGSATRRRQAPDAAGTFSIVRPASAAGGRPRGRHDRCAPGVEQALQRRSAERSFAAEPGTSHHSSSTSGTRGSRSSFTRPVLRWRRPSS
jgi:hypothetical protein